MELKEQKGESSELKEEKEESGESPAAPAASDLDGATFFVGWQPGDENIPPDTQKLIIDQFKS